jgi:hypothetical protein
MAHDDLIWQNRALGTRTYFHDVDENTVALETVQDVGPIIEANKRDLNNVDDPRIGDGKLVARISMVMLMQLVQQGILDCGLAVLDDKRFSRWLNDNDNRNWRTWPGKV